MILKRVPRDLLPELQVPKRILAYLDTPFYYSEQIADWADLGLPSSDPAAPARTVSCRVSDVGRRMSEGAAAAALDTGAAVPTDEAADDPVPNADQE